MERYTFSERNHKVAVGSRLKDYNQLSSNIWDYLEQEGFQFHGTIRDWSAVFFQDSYFVLHHFLNDKPQEECIPKDSELKWNQIIERNTNAGRLFSFLENNGFQTLVPVQAFVDAYLDDGADWQLQSPKHKFQMYCFHDSCSLLIELYMQNMIPPYGANREPQPYPVDRCQLLFDFDVDVRDKNHPRRRKRVAEGETLDILEKVDEELLQETRMRIKKIYDEHSRIGLLNSGGKDSRLVLQLMIEHALKYPDPTKKIMVIGADTLVENPGVKSIIHELKNAISKALPEVEYHIVEPREDDTLLVCIIGKGYQAPSATFKYCVRRLKIDPARYFLEDIFLREGAEDTCLVLGSRENESSDRKQSIQKFFGEHFYGHHPVGSIRTASPIRDWTSQEVVTYLTFNRAPWSRYGARNTELLAFYGSAAGSECPLGAAVINENEALMQCGKSARTGCYLCTVSHDWSMSNLITSYPEYEKYYRFRAILKSIGQDIRYGGIVGLQRIGKSQIGSGIGDLTIDARSHLLEAMIELGIEWRKSEIITSFQMVLQRETVEGFPVTRRFKEAIYRMLGITGGFRSLFCHSVFDPYGTGVDQFGADDEAAIRRILENEESVIRN